MYEITYKSKPLSCSTHQKIVMSFKKNICTIHPPTIVLEQQNEPTETHMYSNYRCLETVKQESNYRCLETVKQESSPFLLPQKPQKKCRYDNNPDLKRLGIAEEPERIPIKFRKGIYYHPYHVK